MDTLQIVIHRSKIALSLAALLGLMIAISLVQSSMPIWLKLSAVTLFVGIAYREFVHYWNSQGEIRFQQKRWWRHTQTDIQELILQPHFKVTTWLIFLPFKTTDGATLFCVVLPDSASTEQRRQLRQLLLRMRRSSQSKS